MKIISQISVFDYSEIEILGDLERCKLVINNVPDDKIIKKLKKIRGKERIDEVFNPSLTVQRAIDTYRVKGYDEDWIIKRIKRNTR